MTVFVADVASYQLGLQMQALRPDCVGVQIKCTEGIDYVDPGYAGWLTQAQSAGLLVVVYHYVTEDDPAAQAAWLAAHIIDKSLPVMLDTEAGAGNLAHILAVADAMAAAGLLSKLVYLPKWYWLEIDSPALAPAFAARGLLLIQADYPSATAGTPASLYPGDGSGLWDAYGGLIPNLLQFTDAAVEGAQRVDMSAYRGSAAQLAALLGVEVGPVPTGSVPPWPGRTFVYTPGATQTFGTDVRAWQQRMALRGWNIAVDGWYGPQSAYVCGEFQIEFHATPAPGLEVDRKVGIHTWTGAWSIPVTR